MDIDDSDAPGSRSRMPSDVLGTGESTVFPNASSQGGSKSQNVRTHQIDGTHIAGAI